MMVAPTSVDQDGGTPHGGDGEVLRLAQERLVRRSAANGIGSRTIARPGAKRSSLRVFGSDDEHDGEPPADDWPALIQPGIYQVGFERAERQRNLWSKSRGKWLIRWRVVEPGTAFGVSLPMWTNAVIKNDRLHATRKLVELYAIATDRRPPRDLHRIPPERFLADCTFAGRVVTVGTNSRQIERPLVLHYSKVQDLIRRESGTPPMFRRSES
jgi:hypothetical protein